MTKWFVVILCVFSGLLYWLSEPYSLVPIDHPDAPEIKIANESECDNYGSDNSIQQKVAQANLLGGSAGVFNLKCGMYVAAFGFSDIGQKIEFELDTLTRVASVTKPMTAVAVMQLKEKGLLTLNDRLADILDDVPVSHSQITIKQLLNHTSGIPHYSNTFEAMSFTKYESLQQVAEMVLQKELKFNSGEGYEYSSFGYSLLGRIIEVVSKQSYEEYMRENIWLPAGMFSTSLEKSNVNLGKAKLYLDINGWFIKSPYTDLSVIFPAGGVESTAKDILLFGKAILENSLIQQDTLAEMIDVAHSMSETVGDSPYSLGWSIYKHEQLGVIISHSGSQPGASGFFQILLDQGITSVSLANSFGSKNRVRQLAYDFAAVAINQ